MRSCQPRVLLFTDADVFAGTERHIADLALALRDEGAIALVACPSPSPLADRVRAAGMEVIPIAKRPMPDWRAVLAVRRMIREGRVELVHSHNGRTSLLAALAFRAGGRGACVTTQHFLSPTRAGRSGVSAALSRLLHRWVDQHTAHSIMISSAVQAAALARGDASRERTTVVLNGIRPIEVDTLKSARDVRNKLGIAIEQPLVVSAARLEREKDVETLILAIAKVVEQFPSVFCAVAGTGGQQSHLQSMIEARALSQHVQLLGFRDDVYDLMNAADVFVLPAPAEPFGLVIAEAMALGKPVVATAAGGPLEIVVNGETGILVPPSAADELGAALLTLLRDPALRARMGAAGRQRFVERFTAARMARETLAVYEKVLSQHASEPQPQGRAETASANVS